MIRRLIVICLVAAGLYGGYWFVGARGLETAVEHWLDERRDDGWLAEWDEVNVRGFPSRFDLTVSALELADPRTGWVWTAPFFQTLALSYKPHHLIAVWPDTQVLQTPLERLDVQSERLRGSMVLTPDSGLALRRASFEIDAIEVRSDAGWNGALEQARVATRVVPEGADEPLTHQISLKAKAWKLPSPLLARLNSADILPDTLDRVEADITVTFSAPWDRYAIERARPQPREVKVSLAEARWGQLELKLAGAFTVDEGGQPTGSLLVKATNWRDILQVSVASGLIPSEFQGPIETALGLISQLAGSPKTLDIPLSFRGGQTWLGPAPIGPAPVIRLR